MFPLTYAVMKLMLLKKLPRAGIFYLSLKVKWEKHEALRNPRSSVLEECLQTVECWEVKEESEVASLDLLPPEWDLLSSTQQWLMLRVRGPELRCLLWDDLALLPVFSPCLRHAKRRLDSAPAKAAQGLVFSLFGDIFLKTPCKFFYVTFKTMNISFGIVPLVLLMSDVF